MTIALKTYALVEDLENVKLMLGVTDDDRDDKITQLVNRVSRAILRSAQREFRPLQDGVTRAVAYYDREPWIYLTPYDAQTVTAITLQPGTDDETELDADTDWQLEPITNPDGAWQRIRLRTTYPATRFGSIPVTVTGTWGWPEVPPDVLGWLYELVEDEWHRDHAFYADADGAIIPPGHAGPLTLPYRIEQELERYHTPRIGGAR